MPKASPRFSRVSLLAGLLAPLAACQSYETGVEVICQAPVRCLECNEAPRELRPAKFAEHLDRLVRNQKADDLLETLTTLDPAARIDALRRESAAAGLSECPLADYFESALHAPVTPGVGAAGEPRAAEVENTGTGGDTGTGGGDGTEGDPDTGADTGDGTGGDGA